MEISNNFGINNPVNMYGTSTSNNLNLIVENEKQNYSGNFFLTQIPQNEKVQKPVKKRKKINKRLNTIDTEFLPDEVEETTTTETNSNFFVEKSSNKHAERIKKIFDYVSSSIPLVNYFYLKQKGEKIHQTVETLNDIIQDADTLTNSAVPYGESNKIYSNIAQNLTKAANVIGQANREFEK